MKYSFEETQCTTEEATRPQLKVTFTLCNIDGYDDLNDIRIICEVLDRAKRLAPYRGGNSVCAILAFINEKYKKEIEND